MVASDYSQYWDAIEFCQYFENKCYKSNCMKLYLEAMVMKIMVELRGFPVEDLDH